MTRQDRTADTLRARDGIESLRSAILTSDAIVIGAGSGLSTAAGFRYSGKFFKRYFGDFMRKYGIRDMYSGGFFPFPTREEFWAWWSRHIWLNRYAPLPGNLYSLLLSIVRDRDFFVLTTNVDHCFQRAGFDKKRLFYTQGDYGLFQSSRPHGASINKTYDNEGMVREMLLSQGFSIGTDGELLLPEDGSPRMEIDSGLIPHCPDDGLEMAPNLRSDDTFVEDDGWHEAAGRYADFLAVHGIKATGFFTEDGIAETNRTYGGRMLFLELGVGRNTPGIIKYPFWQMTFGTENARYACVSLNDAYAPPEIRERSVCIDGDLRETIEALARN